MIEILAPGHFDMYCDSCEEGVVHVVARDINAAIITIRRRGWVNARDELGGTVLHCPRCTGDEVNGIEVNL